MKHPTAYQLDRDASPNSDLAILEQAQIPFNQCSIGTTTKFSTPFTILPLPLQEQKLNILDISGKGEQSFAPWEIKISILLNS
jgi:hypothetical protein